MVIMVIIITSIIIRIHITRTHTIMAMVIQDLTGMAIMVPVLQAITEESLRKIMRQSGLQLQPAL